MKLRLNRDQPGRIIVSRERHISMNRVNGAKSKVIETSVVSGKGKSELGKQ